MSVHVSMTLLKKVTVFMWQLKACTSNNDKNNNLSIITLWLHGLSDILTCENQFNIKNCLFIHLFFLTSDMYTYIYSIESETGLWISSDLKVLYF